MGGVEFNEYRARACWNLQKELAVDQYFSLTTKMSQFSRVMHMKYLRASWELMNPTDIYACCTGFDTAGLQAMFSKLLVTSINFSTIWNSYFVIYQLIN
jgi:hypothetical protein